MTERLVEWCMKHNEIKQKNIPNNARTRKFRNFSRCMLLIFRPAQTAPEDFGNTKMMFVIQFRASENNSKKIENFRKWYFRKTFGRVITCRTRVSKMLFHLIFESHKSIRFKVANCVVMDLIPKNARTRNFRNCYKCMLLIFRAAQTASEDFENTKMLFVIHVRASEKIFDFF